MTRINQMPRMKAGPGSYRDIREMLDLAMDNGGAIFNCGSQTAAIRVVQRMNQYRIIDRKVNYEKIKNKPPTNGDLKAQLDYDSQVVDMYGLMSFYDHLVIRRPVDGRVIVEKKPAKPYIEAFNLSGEKIHTNNTQTETIDVSPEFLAFDQELKRQIEAERKIIPGGTTQAPREKHDKPGVPLNLNEPDE